MKLLLYFSALLVFMLSSPCVSADLKITGVIIAHDPLLRDGGELSTGQIFLIRVTNITKGKLCNKYIIATYLYSGGEPISDKILDGKSPWLFNLKSDDISQSVCFRSILYIQNYSMETGEPLKESMRLIFLVNTKIIEEIGVDSKLPLFHFSKGDFKILK